MENRNQMFAVLGKFIAAQINFLSKDETCSKYDKYSRASHPFHSSIIFTKSLNR